MSVSIGPDGTRRIFFFDELDDDGPSRFFQQRGQLQSQLFLENLARLQSKAVAGVKRERQHAAQPGDRARARLFDISSCTESDIEGWANNRVARLRGTDLQKLTPEQLTWMTPIQVRAIKPAKICYLGRENLLPLLQFLSTEQFQAVVQGGLLLEQDIATRINTIKPQVLGDCWSLIPATHRMAIAKVAELETVAPSIRYMNSVEINIVAASHYPVEIAAHFSHLSSDSIVTLLQLAQGLEYELTDEIVDRLITDGHADTLWNEIELPDALVSKVLPVVTDPFIFLRPTDHEVRSIVASLSDTQRELVSEGIQELNLHELEGDELLNVIETLPLPVVAILMMDDERLWTRVPASSYIGSVTECSFDFLPVSTALKRLTPEQLEDCCEAAEEQLVEREQLGDYEGNWSDFLDTTAIAGWMKVNEESDRSRLLQFLDELDTNCRRIIYQMLTVSETIAILPKIYAECSEDFELLWTSLRNPVRQSIGRRLSRWYTTKGETTVKEVADLFTDWQVLTDHMKEALESYDAAAESDEAFTATQQEIRDHLEALSAIIKERRALVGKIQLLEIHRPDYRAVEQMTAVIPSDEAILQLRSSIDDELMGELMRREHQAGRGHGQANQRGIYWGNDPDSIFEDGSFWADEDQVAVVHEVKSTLEELEIDVNEAPGYSWESIVRAGIESVEAIDTLEITNQESFSEHMAAAAEHEMGLIDRLSEMEIGQAELLAEGITSKELLSYWSGEVPPDDKAEFVASIIGDRD